MLARFDHAEGSVIFSRAPLYGKGAAEALQAQARSAGGQLFAGEPAAVERTITLQWRGMPTSEADALETFLRSVVNGMAEQFEYTAADGTVYSVSFGSPEIDRQATATGREAVTLDLIVEQ